MIFVGIFGWIVLTGACGVLSFGLTRNFVVQTGNEFPLPDLPNFSQRPTAVPVVSLPTPAPQDTVPETASDTPTEVAPASNNTPAEAAAPVVEDNTPPNDNALIRGALQRVGPRKITVLLLGIDQRSAVESADDEYFRTDTMIVLQIDPVRRTAGMLSVPRDLYVDIPGFRTGRINTANYLGDANGYPGGGPALAMTTIRDTLGLEVNHYVLVNFDVFTTVVDTIAPNGVEICVQETIHDEKYPDEGYGTIVVHFDPGCQRLNSERLLQYARTRATQGSDFDRARRQQQVITAVQREVVSAGGFANLLLQAPTLWSQLAGNLRTDMTFEQAIDIALIATTVNRDNMQTSVIDSNYVKFETDESGAQILIPVPSAISVLIQDTFNVQGDLTVEDLKNRAAVENATIAVLNNTTTQGLATTSADWLRARGVSVTTVGNAITPTETNTVIRDYTGNPWTARYLAAVMGLSPEQILVGGDAQSSTDVAVLIGADISQILGVTPQ